MCWNFSELGSLAGLFTIREDVSMQFMPSFIYRHLVRAELVNTGSLFYTRSICRHFPPLHPAMRVCGRPNGTIYYDVQAVASNMSHKIRTVHSYFEYRDVRRRY